MPAGAGKAAQGGGEAPHPHTTGNRGPQRSGRGGIAPAGEGNGSDCPEGEPPGGRVRGGAADTHRGSSRLRASLGGTMNA